MNYCVWCCCLELKCYYGLFGNISVLNKIMSVFIYIEHLLIFPRGTYYSEIFFPNKYISYPKRTWIFPSLTIQLNFLPFGRKMFAFTVWKYCTFQRKRVAIRWALHLPNTRVPTLSIWYPEMGLLPLQREPFLSKPGQLAPISLPRGSSSCSLLHHCALPVCGITLRMWLPRDYPCTSLSLLTLPLWMATLATCIFLLRCCWATFHPRGASLWNGSWQGCHLS